MSQTDGSAGGAVAAALDPDRHTEALGRTIGQAGWTVASAAAGFAGRAAVAYMQQPKRARPADAGGCALAPCTLCSSPY